MSHHTTLLLCSLLLLHCCLIVVSAASGPLDKYSLPTFKTTITPQSNPQFTSKIYADAVKKIVRYDYQMVQPESKLMSRGIMFLTTDMNMNLVFQPGNDSSISCTYHDSNFTYVFENVMFGASYLGLRALDDSVGYAYYLTLFLDFPGTLVIDAFTLFPAVFEAKQPIKDTYHFESSILTREESDQMLVLPKGIPCRKVPKKY